jgi:hypothetical protein
VKPAGEQLDLLQLEPGHSAMRSIAGRLPRAFDAQQGFDSTPLGNMYLANRYHQRTCDDKVHTVPFGTAAQNHHKCLSANELSAAEESKKRENQIRKRAQKNVLNNFSRGTLPRRAAGFKPAVLLATACSR